MAQRKLSSCSCPKVFTTSWLQGCLCTSRAPGVDASKIWQRSGRDVNALPAVMEGDDLVDAALVGFDRREVVTLPSLPDVDQWIEFEAARKVMCRITTKLKQRCAMARRRNASGRPISGWRAGYLPSPAPSAMWRGRPTRQVRIGRVFADVFEGSWNATFSGTSSLISVPAEIRLNT